MIDLCKVVIFAGQPEDGHMRPARLRRLPRARQRRRRLERREQRPAEQPHLLPRHHHARAGAQRVQRPAPVACGFCSASTSTSSAQCAGTRRPAPATPRRMGAKPIKRPHRTARRRRSPGRAGQSREPGDRIDSLRSTTRSLPVGCASCRSRHRASDGEPALLRMPRQAQSMHDACTDCPETPCRILISRRFQLARRPTTMPKREVRQDRLTKRQSPQARKPRP